uniref:Protein ABSCISIC ACID-INSENSITIVE 5-like n=1 Tax=Cicer arietinum TaxID=3827 RepID=A0A1S2Z394_CICAR|nr:protein ABSCISIC ACID-INSENSITIVE 5-like [Cicer arietinum]
MNLDDLLKDLITAETSQLMQNPSSVIINNNNNSLLMGSSSGNNGTDQTSISGKTYFDNMGNQDSDHVIGDATQVPFIGIEPNLVMASHQIMDSDEMMEKTIERRQKRMAKNRESAARSREKKQKAEERLLSATNFTRKYQLRRISSAYF